MKRNKKYGISLVSLVFTILIILILITTIVVSFDNVYVATKRKDFANEIYNIQKLVEMYHFRNNVYPTSSNDEYVYVDLSKLNNEEQEQFANETQQADSKIILKRLDLYEAGVEESKNGHGNLDNKDIYCVSEDTGIVYYIKGKEYENKVYYTLTEDLKEQLGLK